MAKKLIQRYLPDPKIIQENRYLHFLGPALHNPNLWQLNRRSAAAAFFVGMFCAFLPIPFQMVVAASLAIVFHSHLPLSVALVWISNPLTMPAMFYFTYKVGCFVLQIPGYENNAFSFSLEAIGAELGRIWKPLYLGSIITGFISGALCYVIMRLYWRWSVISMWRKRHKKTTKTQ